MDVTAILVVCGLLFLVVVILLVLLLSGRREKIEFVEVTNEEREKKQEKIKIEFSKMMLMALLGMWMLGGLVGFWVVIFCDFSFLKEVQTYVQYPVTAGIGFYSCKSGAENLKKLSWEKREQNQDESQAENLVEHEEINS